LSADFATYESNGATIVTTFCVSNRTTKWPTFFPAQFPTD
jgi:hypothetical protein